MIRKRFLAVLGGIKRAVRQSALMASPSILKEEFSQLAPCCASLLLSCLENARRCSDPSGSNRLCVGWREIRAAPACGVQRRGRRLRGGCCHYELIRGGG